MHHCLTVSTPPTEQSSLDSPSTSDCPSAVLNRTCIWKILHIQVRLCCIDIITFFSFFDRSFRKRKKSRFFEFSKKRKKRFLELCMHKPSYSQFCPEFRCHGNGGRSGENAIGSIRGPINENLPIGAKISRKFLTQAEL